MEQQIVVFEMANEHSGINIASVESFVKLQQINHLLDHAKVLPQN
jgi:chemotaxis signal transduction protein